MVSGVTVMEQFDQVAVAQKTLGLSCSGSQRFAPWSKSGSQPLSLHPVVAVAVVVSNNPSTGFAYQIIYIIVHNSSKITVIK